MPPREGSADDTVASTIVPWTRDALRLGVEVRNLFDFRGAIAATVSGYPHAEINTVYDDYGAYRSETGRGGDAYWNDATGDGRPGCWTA